MSGGNIQMVTRMVWNDGAKKARALATEPAKASFKALARDALILDNPLRKGALPPLQGMLIDGKEAFAAIEKTISGAKKSLLLETFTFKNDETGKKVADLLIQKRKAGVDVRVLLDTYGTSTNLPDAPYLDFYKSLKQNGVDVRLHNPHVYTLKDGMPITHRKMVIADGEQFITGGMNISDRYAKEWHDTMIGLQGPSAADATAAFNKNWTRAGGEAVPVPRYAQPDPRVRVLANDPEAGTFALTEGVMNELKGAKKSIKVQMPYLSDDDFVNHLIEARQRGVKVDVILPRLNDEKVYLSLNDNTAIKLMKNDINVRWYSGKKTPDLPREHFSHTKFMMFDDRKIVVGSANADARTFKGNHELSVVVQDRKVVGEAKNRLWNRDWAAARPANLDELTDVSLGKKAMRQAWKLLTPFI